MGSAAPAAASDFVYLWVLVGCILAVAGLPWLLRVRVLNRWRRLLLSVLPAAVVFIVWDAHAINAGHWWFNPRHMSGVMFGNLPLEELLFFLVVPLCTVMAYEAIIAGRNQPKRSSGEGDVDVDVPEAGERL